MTSFYAASFSASARGIRRSVFPQSSTLRRLRNTRPDRGLPLPLSSSSQTFFRPEESGFFKARMPDHLADAIRKGGAELGGGAEPVTSRVNVRTSFYSRLTTPVDQIMEDDNESLFVRQDDKDTIDAEDEQRSQKLRAEAKARCACRRFSNGLSGLWKSNAENAVMLDDVITENRLFSTLMYAGWMEGTCGSHLRIIKYLMDMKLCGDLQLIIKAINEL